MSSRRARRPSRRRKKGVLSAIRLCASVIGVTIFLAVGVNLSLQETDEIDTLADPSQVWTGERVRVEVLNAGGVSGMARAATEELRDVGFDVVSFGNAEAFDPERPSEVVDRVGRTDVARAVATALGIDNVQTDPDPNLYVDVTVVVGHDWPGSGASKTAGPDEGEAVWWDPRSWF